MGNQDRIIIQGIGCSGIHGVLEQERLSPQRFIVDLELALDLSVPCASDLIDDTVDYSKVIDLVTEIVSNNSYNLIERLAESVAEQLLELELVETVRVRVSKPQAPIEAQVGNIAVEICRSTYGK